MTPSTVVTALVLLLGIQPITTDLYLPALPNLQQDLVASVAATQLTLSALIIAFGVAQLICGPLADRFGRRPVLLIGMALYTLASLLAALAPSIEWLVVWRAAQGAAMAAAVTCGRSIVRDLYPPRQGARMLARGLGGLGLIAFASPLLGGAIVHFADWHAALLVPALFGAGSLGFIALRFTETVPEPNPRATQLAPLLRNWRATGCAPRSRSAARSARAAACSRPRCRSPARTNFPRGPWSCRVGCSWSATAFTSPAGKPAPSGLSRRKPAPRRRSRAS